MDSPRPAKGASVDPYASASDPHRLPLAVLFLGISSIILLVGTDHLRQRTAERNLARITALDEIQVAVSISHLWLEEYVTGDQVEVAEIFDNLDLARHLVRGLLDDPVLTREQLRLEPLEDRDLRRKAAAMRNWLQNFHDISVKRHEGFHRGRPPVGIGSALDVQYDSVFGRLLGEARGLRADLEEFQARSRRQSTTIFWSIVLAWSVIVAFATVGLWNRERQRRQAAEALRESQRQLFESQKMEAVGRLAGGLAHDVNNYLAAIRGHCELVRMKRPDDDPVAKKMDAAVRIVSKAASLMERLQTVRQDRPLLLEVVNLNRVVAALRKMIAPSLGQGVEVRTDLAAGLWNVRIDPRQLEQLIVNLMINASDAMPEGGQLLLSTANSTRQLPRLAPRELGGGDDDGEWALGEWVELTVADNGVGIAPEIRDRIFEPFLTTKAHSERRGLGLSIVYSAVKQHGGHIELSSEVGRGTTFRIYFPRCHEEETTVLQRAERLGGREDGTECILLVDDNPDFRESTAGLLTALGYRLHVAANGEEALRLFESQGEEIDLVLTDVVMPGLSGFDLVRRLRELRPVKAVFMSGYDDRVMARHDGRPGEDAFLKKVSSAGELARTLRALFDTEPPSRS